MSRYAQSKHKRAGEDDDVQLEACAFTPTGWCLHHGQDQRRKYLQINARGISVSTTKWETTLKQQSASESRPSILPTPRELQVETETGVSKFLVVGLALSKDQCETYEMDLDKNLKGMIGCKIPDGKCVYVTDQLKPFIVVTPIKPDQTQVALGVLLEHNKGLSAPYMIKQLHVFYYDEFRDDTTALQKRLINWNALVLQHSNRQIDDRQPTEKQVRFKRARDPTKLVLNPTISLANELSFLTAAFHQSKDPWILDEMMQVIDAVQEDNTCRKLTSESMVKFVDKEHEFSEDDASTMKEEFNDMWPEVANVTAKGLVILNRGMKAAVSSGDMEEVEGRLLRGFVAEGVELLGKPFDDPAAVAISASETVLRVLGPEPKESMASIPTDELRGLLLTVIAKLREIVDASKDFNANMKEQFGDAALAGTVNDIWEQYSASCDMDTSRMAFNTVCRFLAARMKYRNKSVGDLCENMLTVLEKLNLEDK